MEVCLFTAWATKETHVLREAIVPSWHECGNHFTWAQLGHCFGQSWELWEKRLCWRKWVVERVGTDGYNWVPIPVQVPCWCVNNLEPQAPTTKGPRTCECRGEIWAQKSSRRLIGRGLVIGRRLTSEPLRSRRTLKKNTNWFQSLFQVTLKKMISTH